MIVSGVSCSVVGGPRGKGIVIASGIDCEYVVGIILTTEGSSMVGKSNRMAATTRDGTRGSRSCIMNLVILAVVMFATCCRADTTCSSNTAEALVEFRAAFSDPSGSVFSSWDNGGDCCSWKGVTCQDGAVTVLDVEGSDSVTSNQSYSGKPGHTLAKLKDLQTLKLKNLQFSSKIPSQWGSFSDSLVVLTVNNCDLQDDIPSGIASNSRLQTLDLKANSLSGDIPSKLCNLKDLKYLDLSYNQLDTSNVPDCIANGGSVTNVNFGHQSSSNSGSDGGDGGSGSSGGSGGNGTVYSPYGYSGAHGESKLQNLKVLALLLVTSLFATA